MKHYFLPALLLCLLAFGCNEEETPEEPVINDAAAYNDSIIHEQVLINQKIKALNEQLAALDSAGIAENYTILLEQTRQSIQDVQNMPAYQEDARLKSAAIELFRFYQDIFNNDYERVISILYKGPDEITEEDKLIIDSISTAIEHKEAMYIEEFQQAHQAFAKDHNLILKEQQ